MSDRTIVVLIRDAVRKARLVLPCVLMLAFAAAAAQGSPVVSTFSGGDPGDGLDLQNDALGFAYALDFRDTPGSNLAVSDVTFNSVTASSAPSGVTVTHYFAPNDNLVTYNFGATTNDDNLESIMNSTVEASVTGINDFKITLAVTPGQTYKLQLLEFGNAGIHREADYTINGVTTDIDLVSAVLYPTAAYLVTDTFVAAGSSLTIEIANNYGGNDSFTGGLTLEALPEPASLSLLGISGLLLLRRQRR